MTARRLTLCGVAALLGWLTWSATHGPHRLEQLRRAVTERQLAPLSEADRTRFVETVRWLAAAADASEPVTVNEEPLTGSLRVYVTTPALSVLTGCQAGNAVYDSELDAIFIDRDLLDGDKYLPMIDASGYGSVLSPRHEIPFARAYLRFVVLHELGHRQLKHATASRWRPIRDDLEAAADRFALDGMMRAFEMGTRFGFSVLEEPLELSPLPVDGTVRQRTWLELAEMAGGVNFVSLFHAGAYGPFFQDRLHPNFITRSRGLIAAARSEDLPDTIRDQLEVIDRALQRQTQSLDAVRWQVTSPNPIGDLAFGTNGVVIASTGLRTASAAQVYGGTSPGTASFPSRRAPARVGVAPTSAGDTMVDGWWKAAIWADAEGHANALTREGQRLRLDKHRWVAVPPVDLRDHDTQVDVFIPPQPTHRVFVQGRGSGGQTWLRVLNASERRVRGIGDSMSTSRVGEVRARPVSEILGDAALLANEPSLARRDPALGTSGEVDVIGIRQDGLSLAIRPDTRHDRVWVAEVDESLTVTRVTSLVLPWKMSGSHASAIVDAAFSEARWLFVSADIERNSRRWSIWRLSEHQPATKLIDHPFMAGGDDTVSARARRVLGEPGVDEAVAIPGGRLLVRLSNDSAYLVDLRSLDVTVAFHPGDDIIRARISARGEVGFFIQGAFTAYVVQ